MNIRYGWTHQHPGELLVGAFPALLRNSRGVPVAFVTARDSPKKNLQLETMSVFHIECAFRMCETLSQPLQ